MDVLESLAAGARASIEVIPPDRGGDLGEILQAVEPLLAHNLAFVSVTDHPGGRAWAEGEAGAERVALRTKPGTLGTAVALREAFHLPTLPHLVSSGADRLAVEDLLIDLHYAGFRDLFVIRGDERFIPAALRPEGSHKAPPGRALEGYAHAADLVAHVALLNRGLYTPPAGGRPTAFKVGVAAYPEKHFESPNPESDVAHLVEKIKAGADYVVTQMVFDAAPYRALVAALRAAGLDLPVIPGIKPLFRAASVAAIPRTFHVNIPQSLVGALEEARSPEEERRAGLDWMVGLCRDLLDAGAPCLHFFTMGRGLGTRAVLDALYGRGGEA